ncbi:MULTISPECIES: hypothetical protein [Priestia]|uniref:Uncharacterized protein n=1 Tax=Priestia aryabhattai TaxID=412384 RepID=A0ABD5KQ82_PRIAR|nr:MULTISPECIES: hypothetical protein [Priestia]MDC7764054.1 hypothetical protein [Priestia aryabhattai]MEB4885994.1 hypothetical protein [Priestia megaterium]MED5118429.1 hypothetical protein [Priestia megaterium]
MEFSKKDMKILQGVAILFMLSLYFICLLEKKLMVYMKLFRL